MSEKNFMAYGDAETVLTGFATDIKAKQPKTLETPITIEGVQKTTVEGALQGLVGSVADGKTSIASAITNKGVQTANNATFQTMANNVTAIPSGGGTDYVLTIKGFAIAPASFYVLPDYARNKYLKKIEFKCTSSTLSTSFSGTAGVIGMSAVTATYFYMPTVKCSITKDKATVGSILTWTGSEKIGDNPRIAIIGALYSFYTAYKYIGDLEITIGDS